MAALIREAHDVDALLSPSTNFHLLGDPSQSSCLYPSLLPYLMDLCHLQLPSIVAKVRSVSLSRAYTPWPVDVYSVTSLRI